MTREQEAQQFTAPLAAHGEGAYWDARRGAWLWVDMLAGCLMITGVDGSTRAVQLPDTVAAAARPTETGDVVVVGERTLWLVDPMLGTSQRLFALDIPDDCRANEAALTRSHGLAVATMAYDASPGRGSVLVVSPEGTVRTALGQTSVANGTVYLESAVLFVDSQTREINLYSADADTWVHNRTLARIDPSHGFPDGICVDAEGAVWVAVWAGGQVQRWSAEGNLLDVVRVPVSQPTSVSLGGADGRTLLITTSSYELPDGHGTEAGALFTARVGVPAAPEPPLPRATVEAWRARDS